MTLPLDPEMMAAAYDYLSATPPFRDWNLPDSEDVKFVVTKSKTDAGFHKIEAGRDIIGASSICIGRTHSLLELIAHEMVHLHQRDVGTETPPVIHNRSFNMLCAKVCKIHGFDPKLF